MLKKIGLIGKNISYSFSRDFFNQKFKTEGITDLTYHNCDIDSINEVVNFLNDKQFLGFNVTIPYKEQIIPYLDQLDVHAQAIGAVNTIKKFNDTYIGYNTDWIGFTQTLHPYLPLKQSKALVLGTGGASKAVIYALTQLGIETVTVSRFPKNNQINYKDITSEILSQCQLIINTTPLGTFPNIEECPPIPYHLLTANHMVYDLIYNPAQTLFLTKAQEMNAKTINGYQMLVNQALESWQIWNN